MNKTLWFGHTEHTLNFVSKLVKSPSHWNRLLDSHPVPRMNERGLFNPDTKYACGYIRMYKNASKPNIPNQLVQKPKQHHKKPTRVSRGKCQLIAFTCSVITAFTANLFLVVPALMFIPVCFWLHTSDPPTNQPTNILPHTVCFPSGLGMRQSSSPIIFIFLSFSCPSVFSRGSLARWLTLLFQNKLVILYSVRIYCTCVWDEQYLQGVKLKTDTGHDIMVLYDLMWVLVV